MVEEEFLKQNKVEKKFIGVISDEVCSSLETKNQIEEIISKEIDIVCDGEKVSWQDFYDKEHKEKRILFNFIIEDRIFRVDNHKMMASRPVFAVCTFVNDVCERMEYYEGEDRLEKTYDLRSERLSHCKLKDYIYKDLSL